MRRIPALRVRQWLSTWNHYSFDASQRQRRPEPEFYLTSISASMLRRLSQVRRRTAVGPRHEDTAIQRGHDVERSEEIRRFVEGGYPWATLNAKQQSQFDDLKKPGWLPTAVVGNLVADTTVRPFQHVDPNQLIRIEEGDESLVHLVLPLGSDDRTWRVQENTAPPIEIIDGQHRLYAFREDENIADDFELPIVLFYDLDISWQAYLFWTINITPKRINPSMAYDLYPLLRTVEWLEKVEGPMAYRETRAQELTEALWSHPDSPWYQRIGMLGRERGKVTQAAFVRSLVLSFVRGWAQRRTGIGGFFGTELSEDRSDVLRWTRAQQAAYLIVLWRHLEKAIQDGDEEWAIFLRMQTRTEDVPERCDAAFAGRYSLLATDQGVRGFLQVANDVSYLIRDQIDFGAWIRETISETPSETEISECIAEIESHSNIDGFIRQLAVETATFDWRSAVTPGLSDQVETFQSRYRSGSGYKQVRLQLLRHLSQNERSEISSIARRIAKALRYSLD